MARQAGVKLTLENAQFLTSVKKSGESVQRMAVASKKALADQFGAGAASAKRSMSGLVGELKMAARWAGTLGGAFTVGSMLKDAVMLQKSYRQIAYGVRDATGAFLKAADVQRITERAAAATGQSNDDMARSFRDLLDASGDVSFSTKVLGAVGTTASATGAELSTLTTLADQLNAKFGVGADEMLSTFAQVFGAARNGGPTFEEFAEVSGAVGAELLAAGLDGKKGLEFMLGALVATDAPLKSLPKQVAGLKAVLRGLGEKSELTKLANKLGIDPKKLINEKDATARIKRIFGAGRAGVKALLAPMHAGSEEQITMKTLFTDPFEKALSDAEKSGLKGQAAIDKALTVVDGGVAAFGKSNMDAASMIQRANEERNSPEAKLTEALNRLKTAFGQPEIIKAIDDLAKHLPELADIVAKVVGFAAKHPVLTVAGGLGAKVGMDIAGDAAGGLLSAGAGALAKKLFGKGAGKLAGGAVESLAGGAGDMAVSGITRAAQMSAEGLTPAMLGAGGEALTAAELGAAGIGTGGLGTVAAGLALPVTAALAAGGMAYGIHRLNVEDDASSELASATASSYGGGNLTAKRAALERLQKAQATMQETDVGGGPLDWAARTLTGVDSREGANAAMKQAAEAIALMQAQIARMESGGGTPKTKAEEQAANAKPKAVSLDQSAPRMIAEATKVALGGMVLTVRMATGPGTGIPTKPGSRDPMSVPPAKQGGAV